jgi:hypothetical protein
MGPVARRKVASLWMLVVTLLIGAFTACSQNDASAPPPSGKGQPLDGKWGKGVYVGPEFTLARAVTGHRVHVVAQKIECTKCHSPTENSMGPPVKPERCAACHEKEAKIEHAEAEAQKRFGPGAKADCTTCHAFVFDGKDRADAQKRAEALVAPVDGGTGAASVHGIETFKPGDCKRCHAEPQGNMAAVASHLTQECLACHKPHEHETPVSAPCSGCHEVPMTHGSMAKTPEEACITCHQGQHDPASAALPTCVECHSKEKPIVPATALFAGGHTDCTGCHQPHQFEKVKTEGCATCHSGVSVIGGGRIGAHNGCTNCHSPHDVKSAAGGACANCHKDVHPDHPKSGGGACVGCHDPHPPHAMAGAGAGASACSSCHKDAHSDEGFHRGVACEKCHVPHDFKLALASVSTCERCHSERVHQVGLNQGHRACTNCHRGLPHHPEPTEVACSTCHGKEHAVVARGHVQCTNCHEPHSGAQVNACGNCHKAEHQTAPKGHQACTSCHEPHGGAAKQACASCHAGQAKTPHGLLATGCATCHRPHGPTGPQGPPGPATVPACTSCHKVASLPGLHAETKHQSCTTCHSGHVDPPGTMRATCLSCHKDRSDHFRDSPRCANCHLFTKTN